MSDSTDGQLIDARLGQLTADEVRALAARIAADPALVQQDRELQAAIGALESLRPAAPPTGLHARVMSRIASAAAVRRPVLAGKGGRPAIPRRSSSWREGGWLRLQPVRDVLAVAALIVLAVGVGVPSVLHLRERNQRIACAANLAQAGQALQAYARVFNDSLPFAGWESAATWRPTADNAHLIRNRRHVYPLLAGGLLAPQALICPSLGGVAVPASSVRSARDFPDDRNLSYAYQNMAGVRPTPRAQPDLPILGDDNPLFAEGVPVFDIARLAGTSTAANSRAHRGAGQNLLTIDGHSIWSSTPNAGINGDNIWTLRHVSRYTGHEGPQTADDSHLLK